MTIAELRTTYEEVQKKETLAESLYHGYVHMKSLSKKGERLRAMLEEGIALANSEQYEMAFESFSKAISFEADADAYHNRGVMGMELGKLRFAIHDFSAAIMFCPTYAAPYFK